MKLIFTICLLVISCSTSLIADEPKILIICSPTASLRIAPKEYIFGQEHDEQASKAMFGSFYDRFMKTLAAPYRDPLQDTQLLYNEQILCLEELPADWLKIEALEQYIFDKKEKKWKHMQGFIKKKQAAAIEKFESPNIIVCKPTARVACFFECSMFLPIGTKLHGNQTLHNNYRVTLLDGKKGYVSGHDIQPIIKHNNGSTELRNSIVATAKELFGAPYCWGGRSAHNKFNKNNPGSVDCSGLINISYRCNSIEIPRNVYPMYLKSNKIAHGNKLKPGDCVFLAPADRPENFNHILMYIGNNQVIESCLAKGVVISDTNERLGKPITELNSGDRIKAGGGYQMDYVIAFGSFLNDKALLRALNEYAMGNYKIESGDQV